MLVRRGLASAAEVDALLQQAEADLARAGRARKGPPVVVIRPAEPKGGGEGGSHAVEVMLPVSPGTPAPDGFEAASLPPLSVAYTIHHGRPDALAGAEAVLADWIKIKALHAVREVRRVYVKRGKNPRKDVTEVQIPLER